MKWLGSNKKLAQRAKAQPKVESRAPQSIQDKVDEIEERVKNAEFELEAYKIEAEQLMKEELAKAKQASEAKEQDLLSKLKDLDA